DGAHRQRAHAAVRAPCGAAAPGHGGAAAGNLRSDARADADAQWRLLHRVGQSRALRAQRLRSLGAHRPLGRLAVRSRRSDGTRQQPAGETQAGMLILTLTDISIHLRAEAEREALLNSERAARAEAERSNRLKEEFLATLSHELRTPLSAILGWSAVISRTEGLPPTVSQGVQAIERNSRLQAQMINDLLDYAGIAYGKLRLAMAVIDPCPVVRAAVDVVQSIAHSAGVHLSASIV